VSGPQGGRQGGTSLSKAAVKGIRAMKPATAVVCVSLVALAAAAMSVSCNDAAHGNDRSEAQSAPEIGVVKVSRRDLAQTLNVSSELVPFQQIDVYAKESGFVQKLNVDYGTHVKAGEVMAVLEIPELQIQIDEDQADIQDAVNQVARANQLLDQVKAEQKVTHLQFTRLNDVAKGQPGLVAQQDVDDSQGKDLSAQAQVGAAQSALQSAQSQLTHARAKQRHDEALFDYANISAPFAGVITKRYANLGTLMQSGIDSTRALPLVQLSEDDLFRLVIPVAESYTHDIRIGDSVDVQVPSLDRTFAGRVARISFDVDESTRTMHTEVDVPNPTGVLMPGMYAESTLTLARKRDVIAVPQQAVNIEGQNRTVWVIGPAGKAENRTVSIGLETPDYVEVLSGLKEGELVAVGDRSGLRAGETVRPKEVQLSQYHD
jgi:RND family efflux transporter MFP subunit